MRDRMVTRTVTVTICECLCMHIATETPELVTYILPGKHASEEALLKKLRREHDSPRFAVVKIERSEVDVRTYGMPEEEFLRLATRLSHRFEKI